MVGEGLGKGTYFLIIRKVRNSLLVFRQPVKKQSSDTQSDEGRHDLSCRYVKIIILTSMVVCTGGG